MSKTIKLDNHVYYLLDAYRTKGETWSDAVLKVLMAVEGITQGAKVLDGKAKSVFDN